MTDDSPASGSSAVSTDPSRFVVRDLLLAASHATREGWQPFREGIEILRIYGSGDAGPAAALLRYHAGAVVPTHRHPDYEHIFVLEGSQSDEHGTYEAGTCLIHAPGSTHSVHSTQGCVVLAVWNQPVVFDAA